MKKTGLNNYPNEFGVEHEPINPPLNATKYIPILHKYIMIKYGNV